MKFSYKKYSLKFRFPAGTSRGVYLEKPTWIIKIEVNGTIGYGECSPLKDLSIDPIDLMDEKLRELGNKLLNSSLPADEKQVYQMAYYLSDEFPSIRFGLETALLDLLNGGNRIIFNNKFVRGEYKIPINGLIWMGDQEFMLEQAKVKPDKGFKCLKMKIGAISFEKELEVIKRIRATDPDLVLRLDANGAFGYDEVLEKLDQLKEYNIHSIEQPIAAGQLDKMKQLCAVAPISIALDEELIGINLLEKKVELLKNINPHYIILKPSLVGGIAACNEWIQIAEDNGIGWWITSALESNIGLNAISQYTAEQEAISFQGLGTGQLFENNFDSPLTIINGALQYDLKKKWNIEL
ncbi:MAG: o-succinylbenzoate synthase [Candidatus Cyclobacteriaceae bacterium M2_1C_046]